MSFKQIIARERDAIMNVLISIITGVLLYFLDFFNLKNTIGYEFALICYTAPSIFVYLLLTFFAEKIKNGKIKITPISCTEKTNKNFVGFSYFCGLEIEIPKDWDVTECYAVLEYSNPIYNSDRKYFDKEIREHFNHSDMRNKRLSWQNPYSSGCKIDFGEHSKEIVNIAQINIGTYITKSQNMDIESFEFSFCHTKPSEYPRDIFGLHEVSVSIHWKLDGIKRTPILFNGYLLSKIEIDNNGGFHPQLILRKGDYREDKEIPSPLFRIK